MWFAPKIATVIDVLTRAALRRSFGGGIRFIAGVVTETIFFLLLAPIMWFAHTLFLVRLLAGPLDRLGRAGARRPSACRGRWRCGNSGRTRCSAPPALGLLALTVPAAIPYALFVAGGPLLSIPLAVVTASPALGRALVRIGLGRLPEETAPPPEMAALALPAIELAAGRRA